MVRGSSKLVADFLFMAVVKSLNEDRLDRGDIRNGKHSCWRS